MSMRKLAFYNFKASFKNYLSLIISIAFTILVLYDFINLVDSGILDQLGTSNARNIEIILQVLSFVISCFMFFFVWYSTNVFLTKRKKEIGIYVFMGLSNQKIGQLYMMETTLIGLTALFLGLFFGVLTTQLFTMILMRLSELSVEISFAISLTPLLMTAGMFIFIYMVFVIKGYANIVGSSVLDMVSANRKNEYVRQNRGILILKTVLGVIILGNGFYLATKDAGMEVMGNVLVAVVLVVIGIYFLFGGLLPVIFQTMAKRKIFLYQRQRNLWINNVIFRMKKNYRTYAMVCVLMLCAVTALAFGFAMKNRHDRIAHFENIYTYQIMGDSAGHLDEFETLIERNNTIDYQTEAELLILEPENNDSMYDTDITLLAYSDVQEIAKAAHLEFSLERPDDDEYIELNRLYVMSLTPNYFIPETQTIAGKQYTSIAATTEPYLGYMQEQMDYMIVNDQTYEQIKPLGQTIHIYNFKISNPYQFEASSDDIQSSPHCLGLVKIDPERDEIFWIKILFSVSVFMFMVFVLASGSILLMKIYNDSFEEQDRYAVLQKIGISSRILIRAITKELQFAFIAPLLIMTLFSYFSVKAIGNVMQTTLPLVNIISVLIIWGCFLIFYALGRMLYIKNIIKKE